MKTWLKRLRSTEHTKLKFQSNKDTGNGFTTEKARRKVKDGIKDDSGYTEGKN